MTRVIIDATEEEIEDAKRGMTLEIPLESVILRNRALNIQEECELVSADIKGNFNGKRATFLMFKRK